MKKLLLFFLLFSLFVAPAFAQILDTEPDKICFCLDPTGNVPGVCDTYCATRAYLMITRPSDASGLKRYSCSFTLPNNVASLQFTPAGDIIIIAGIFPEIAASYPTPLPPTGETYLLGSWDLMVTDFQPSVVELDILPVLDPYHAGYTTVDDPDNLIPLNPPDWTNGMPPLIPSVLWINQELYCDYIVGATQCSWGRLKTLFR